MILHLSLAATYFLTDQPVFKPKTNQPRYNAPTAKMVSPMAKHYLATNHLQIKEYKRTR